MGFWVEDANGKFLFNITATGVGKMKGAFKNGVVGASDIPVLVKRLKKLGGDEDAKKVLKAKPPIILTDGTSG